MAKVRVQPPRALTIAGSDSGGGAGIQADLKTFQALGCYGMSAITSVTAQNTVGVQAIHDIPPRYVGQQIDAVLEDIGADAVKTGMLSNIGIMEAVAQSLQRHFVEKLVIDPVMVATSGDPLMQQDAVEALKHLLVPVAWVITPNIPEAELLSGLSISNTAEMKAAGEAIYALGPRFVLVKGGHLTGAEAEDWLFDGEQWHGFTSPRLDTPHTHGTGCTLAAAITAYLAQELEVPVAVDKAKKYLTEGIRMGQQLGQGHGPVHHGWAIQPPQFEADD